MTVKTAPLRVKKIELVFLIYPRRQLLNWEKKFSKIFFIQKVSFFFYVCRGLEESNIS